jgi:hypothetical protein
MLHEAGLDARYESVDLATRATEAGADFRMISPKGSYWRSSSRAARS